jgi:hypothetical protein
MFTFDQDLKWLIIVCKYFYVSRNISLQVFFALKMIAKLNQCLFFNSLGWRNYSKDCKSKKKTILRSFHSSINPVQII